MTLVLLNKTKKIYMPKKFVSNNLKIQETKDFINQIVPIEGHIILIDFYDNMIFIKVKDDTGTLDVTLLNDKAKLFGPSLKKIKDYSQTKILVEGMLKEFPQEIDSELGYEMIVNQLTILTSSEA